MRIVVQILRSVGSCHAEPLRAPARPTQRKGILFMLLPLRRLATRVAEIIDTLVEFVDWFICDGLTRKDIERLTARPGTPGYLPPKEDMS
jgi:hypothetical protein